jgi:competence protein ComEA
VMIRWLVAALALAAPQGAARSDSGGVEARGAEARGVEARGAEARGVEARGVEAGVEGRVEGTRLAGRLPAGESERAGADSRRGPRRSAPIKNRVTGVVNLNRASEAELRLLPGIGRGRARAIIARRTKRPFTSVEEVARMKGMKGIVRKLRSHLTVQGDTTLRPVPP